MTSPTEHIPILGTAFFAAFFIGKAAKYVKLPKVTAYILVGIILGPSALGYINESFAQEFHIINDIVFGLVLFTIGGEFHRELFKKLAWNHVGFSILLSLLNYYPAIDCLLYFEKSYWLIDVTWSVDIFP